ncbi:carbohydrate sulfotransferase 11-like isoform X1 [Artemia franciscana]|uniref:carbohydrate sulfotransferase 11-like isoform X1 n=2 Tax=Artemia franciscana TaxID=6661 RepID=UPI0032D9AFCF
MSQKAFTVVLLVFLSCVTTIYYHIRKDTCTMTKLSCFVDELRENSSFKHVINKTNIEILRSGHLVETNSQHASTLGAPFTQSSSRADRAATDLKRIKEVCKKYKGTEYDEDPANVSHWHSSVDDEHRLIYYYIPKTGCSLWKAIFAILTKQSNETDAVNVRHYDVHFRMKFPSLYKLDDDVRERKLNSYFVFAVVRHPFERLVSGYNDKLGDPGEKYFQRTYGTRIIEEYRRGATPKEIKSGKPTFSEYVEFLINPKTVKTYKIDSHWAQYYKIIHPCFIKYDYIVRFEHMKEDTQYILDSRNLGNIVKFTYKDPVTSSEKLNKFMRQLTISQIYKLYDSYKFDFELFGYDFDIHNYI